MKKLLFIVVFVSMIFISLLNSLGLKCQKAQGYPLYEQVGKEEVSDYKKKHDRRGAYFSTKQNSYHLLEENKIVESSKYPQKFVTLNNKNGTALWTMKAYNQKGFERDFFVSSKGVTFIRNYEDWKSIAWVDIHGEVINRMEFTNNLTSDPILIGKEDHWIIKREPDYREFDESYDFNAKSSLIFCDGNGNVLNEVVMKYASLHNDFTISENDNYIMYYCRTYGVSSYVKNDYHSYLLNFDGSIIKEYEGKALTKFGDFSENEDVHVSSGRSSYIVDIETGDIISAFRTHGRSVVANKETGIVALIDFDDLRILNYETKRLLFHKRFELDSRANYLEISGDAKEVIVITKDHQYTFRMKE